MKATLLKRLNERDMQAMVETLNLNAYIYPTLFPLRSTISLEWKNLYADSGIPVAADVIASSSTIPRKERDAVQLLTGPIPKIGIGRDLSESELNELMTMEAMARTSADQQALLRKVYDDIAFTFNGVNARLEWIALQSLSTGKCTFTNANNVTAAKYSVDWNVPTARKTAVSTVWSNTASTPIADIKTIIKNAKKSGRIYKYIFMNQDTFDYMVATTEVKNFAATWVTVAANAAQSPTLETLNTAMRGNSLPEIKIVESYIQIEIDGTRTTVNCWYDGIVTFVTDIVQGYTYHAPLAEERVQGSSAFLSKRGHILVKKYVKEEPLTECTLSMANAFPGWGASQMVHLLRTDGTSWIL